MAAELVRDGWRQTSTMTLDNLTDFLVDTGRDYGVTKPAGDQFWIDLARYMWNEMGLREILADTPERTEATTR